MATMMRTPLLMKDLLNRGAVLQPDTEVVTKTSRGYAAIPLREHQRRASRLAFALRGWGLRVGDRVGSFMWNSNRHLQLYHAVPCMGAVLHTVNIRLSAAELEYIVPHGGARVLFVDADLVAKLPPGAALAGVELLVVCGLDEQPGDPPASLLGIPAVDYEAFLSSTGEEGEFPWPDDLDENAPMALCYTSGTTGHPKGVCYSHRSCYLHTLAAAMTDSMRLSGVDCIAPVVPYFHAQAWGLPFVALMLGSRLAHPGRFMAPQQLLALLADQAVTVSAGVPTIWQTVRGCLEAGGQSVDLRSLSRLMCGGSKPPLELMQWWARHYDVQFVQSWGMTECSPIATLASCQTRRADLSLSRAQQLEQNVATAGIPMPTVQLRVVHPEDPSREMPRGEMGLLLVRGPSVTGAYYRVDAADKFHDGWLITGDLATLSPGGVLRIMDRQKDVLKSGGEWIPTVALENAIVALPRVRLACVVGVPHPRWDERPVALVVLEDPAAAADAAVVEQVRAEAVAAVAAGFAKWQVPDDVLVVDSIPLTSTGKLDKKTVRANLERDGYRLPEFRSRL